MQPDEEEPRSRYSGPFVCIRLAGDLAWSVSIEPILANGEGQPRTFASKHEAFGQARSWWTEHKLPCRDMTVSETARANREK